MSKLDMTQEQLAAVGLGMLGMHRPVPGFTARLPVGDGNKPPPPAARTGRSLVGPPEAVDLVADVLNQEARRTAAKVEEKPEPEPPQETEHQKFLRENTARLEQLAGMKQKLHAIARARGIDQNAPVDTANARAQALADAEKLLLQRALEKRKQRREEKERARVLKRLRP